MNAKIYSSIPKERCMTLLRSKVGWSRWMRDHGIVPSESEPPIFPCYGFMVVRSFGYEEEMPIYLSIGDLDRMHDDLTRAWVAAQPPILSKVTV